MKVEYLIQFRANLNSASLKDCLEFFQKVDFYVQNTPKHKWSNSIIDELSTTLQAVLTKYNKLPKGVSDNAELKTLLTQAERSSVNLARMVEIGGDKSFVNDYEAAVTKFKDAYTLVMRRARRISIPNAKPIVLEAANSNLNASTLDPRQQIEAYIKNNKINLAIENLLQVLPEEKQKRREELVLLQSRLTEVEERSRNGHLTSEEVQRDRNKIKTSLMFLKSELGF